MVNIKSSPTFSRSCECPLIYTNMPKCYVFNIGFTSCMVLILSPLTQCSQIFPPWGSTDMSNSQPRGDNFVLNPVGMPNCLPWGKPLTGALG